MTREMFQLYWKDPHEREVLEFFESGGESAETALVRPHDGL